MSKEACRIIITQELGGLINVSAPMRHKDLCYDILREAKTVIKHTNPAYFIGNNQTLLITMNMTGLVDVSAPLPPKDYCFILLKAAKKIIEEFESSEQKNLPSGYADSIPST